MPLSSFFFLMEKLQHTKLSNLPKAPSKLASENSALYNPCSAHQRTILRSSFSSLSHTYFIQVQYISKLYFMCMHFQTPQPNHQIVISYYVFFEMSAFEMIPINLSNMKSVWRGEKGWLEAKNNNSFNDFAWVKNQKLKKKNHGVEEEGFWPTSVLTLCLFMQ